MSIYTKEQIEKVFEDISSIKAVIHKNKPFLRELLHPRQYRILAFLSAISIFGFSGVFHILIRVYGDYVSVPQLGKYFLYIAIALVWALLGFLKYYRLDSSISRLDKSYSLSRVLTEFFSFRIVHVYVPMMLIMGFLIYYFVWLELFYLVVPTISVCVGIIYNFIGSITEIRRYLLCGYWYIVTGILSSLEASLPITLVLSVTMGVGMLIYALPTKEESLNG